MRVLRFATWLSAEAPAKRDGLSRALVEPERARRDANDKGKAAARSDDSDPIVEGVEPGGFARASRLALANDPGGTVNGGCSELRYKQPRGLATTVRISARNWRSGAALAGRRANCGPSRVTAKV